MDAKAFEKWADERWPDPIERKKNAWVLAAVKAHTRWGEGREVTQSDFDAAVEQVMGLSLGGGPPPPAAPEH